MGSPWAVNAQDDMVRGVFPQPVSLGPRVEELNQAVGVQAGQRSDCQELMKVKGVGPVTSLAYVLILGPVERFPNSGKVVSYLGLNPSEHSSGGRQRLGHISNSKSLSR